MQLKQIVWLDFDYKSKHYEGEAISAYSIPDNGLPPAAFDIYFNNEYNGTMLKQHDNWIPDNHIEEGLGKIIGRKLFSLLVPE